ncbi:MAG: hypothetical protein QM747_12485 [Nocardioides sp.]
MSLRTECPRCPSPLDDATCPVHGPMPVLRRPDVASYESFAEALGAAGELPTYLPWPMSPGWAVTDFAVVDGRGTMTCCSGTSALDGPVDVLVVSEESGTGLGARCAGMPHLDPGREIGVGSPMVRVRIGSQSVPLWSVSTADAEGELDRSVVAGEAGGRWLWVVLRPASAMLLLRDEWILRDVSAIGAPLVEMAFSGPGPLW